MDRINLLKKIKPRHVFGSSEPAYHIVYQDQKSFEGCEKSGGFDAIKKVCHDVLHSNDLLCYYAEDKVTIKIRHCEEKDINLYGLSRED